MNMIRCKYFAKLTFAHLTFIFILGLIKVLENLESPGILLTFSRAGMSWKKATVAGEFWKSVKLK